MKKGTLLYLAQAGMIAAIYAALTYLAMALNLAYGSIQFRFSEALTILPIFTPAAVPGLAIGCLIGNLASPYPLDLVFGTAASLIAALLTRAVRKVRIKNVPVLAPLPPVLVNAIIVGLQITLFTPGEAASFWGVPDRRRAGGPRPACGLLSAGSAAGYGAGEKRSGKGDFSAHCEKMSK